jgi:hypothetical protein
MTDQRLMGAACEATASAGTSNVRMSLERYARALTTVMSNRPGWCAYGSIMSTEPDPLKAKMFAEIAHAGQTYNDEVPYVHHVQAVVDVLARFNFTSNAMRCAGLLHDVIEDTNRSYNDIKKRFGEHVAELVYAVTSETGRNRAERNKKTYPKIYGNFEATALKLADRIANVEYGFANGGKQDMYSKEYPEFYRNLYCTAMDGVEWPDDDPRVELMWKHLTRLLGDPLAHIKLDATGRRIPPNSILPDGTVTDETGTAVGKQG